jgi:hypothetical protein
MEQNFLFIEDGKKDVWRHGDSDIVRDILLRAAASELGVLRLKVSDLNRAADLLTECGYSVERSAGVIEGSGGCPIDLQKIVAVMMADRINVEITAVIPCIYQG